MSSGLASEFNNVILPADERQRRVRLVVVSSVALSFISFWRAAAIVLNDLASTCYYIGGISEQAIGKAAPWFVLAVMLFSYAVRAVYVESCTMFTRGGVYRVVKQAETALFGQRLGGVTAKLSVSALMFDYILTGPISAVSAGQYLVGLIGSLAALPPFHAGFSAADHPALVKSLSVLVAIGITIYFWRTNLLGMGESSRKALRIMQLTAIMGTLVIGWSLLTLVLRPELRQLPTFRPILTAESSGWLANWPHLLGAFGVIIAFGHSLLAMSGEESLAQVNRELAAPKVKNLLRAGLVIFVFSLLLTGLVSLFAVLIIPDDERIHTQVIDATGNHTQVLSVVEQSGQRIATLPDGSQRILPHGSTIHRESGRYTDNLISGLAMHLSGPHGLRLAMQAFVVLVGFLILAGAVNTSIVGSNGVLNRLAEDGILTPWFLHPHKRFGTTHRLIDIIALLQIATILASRGDVYTLGEAYAFGVIWSFVFKAFAMVVLRFTDLTPREYAVPLNIPFKRHRRRGGGTIRFPVGIAAIFLILFSTALFNLLTKKVATIWGLSFTAAFLVVFLICERISHHLRNGEAHEHREQFNEAATDHPTPESLGLKLSNPVLVAVRNPRSMGALKKVLHENDPARQEIVVVTCKVLPPLTIGIQENELKLNDRDREVLTAVVTAAEEAGKTVHPLVIPTNNPLYAIARTARQLGACEIVLGISEKSDADTQLEQFAIAWGLSADEPSPPLNAAPRVRIAGETLDLVFDLE